MKRDMKTVPLITMAAAMHERRAVITMGIFCLICIATVGYLFAQHQSCTGTITEVVREVTGIAMPGGE